MVGIMSISDNPDFIQSIDVKDFKENVLHLQNHLRSFYAQCRLLKSVFRDLPQSTHSKNSVTFSPAATAVRRAERRVDGRERASRDRFRR